MFSRQRARFLETLDSVLRRVHDANRNIVSNVKRWFWNFGFAKAYYNTLAFLSKVIESIGFAFGFILHILLSMTVHSTAADSIRKASDTTAKRVNRSWEEIANNIADKAEQSIFTAWLVKLLRIVRACTRTIFGFGIDWLWTRNFWLLLGAIPAALLSIPVAYFLIRIPLQDASSTANSYQKAIREAIEAEDFDAVALYNRRIAQLGNRPQNSMAYRAALKLEEKGLIDEAYAQMQKLAPTESPGFAAAHMWIVNHLRSGDLRNDSQTDDQVNAIIKKHLQHVTAKEPDYGRASRLLAAIHLAEGDRETALALLNENRKKYVEPIDKVRAAGLYQQLGEFEIAEDLFRSAEQTTTTRAQFSADLPPMHFIGKAEIEFSKGELNSAIRTLTTGRGAHPDSQGIAQYLVSLQRTRYDLNAHIYTPNERFEKLSSMLEISPVDSETLNRIGALVEFPTIVTKVEECLENAATKEGVDLAVVNKLLGSAYAIQRKFDESRTAYEEVIQRTPDEAESLNNLSWLYSHQQPLKMKLALEYSQKAVQIDPANPHFRDTLGHIYMLTERWPDAVEQLRNALNGCPTTGRRTRHWRIATSS